MFGWCTVWLTKCFIPLINHMKYVPFCITLWLYIQSSVIKFCTIRNTAASSQYNGLVNSSFINLVMQSQKETYWPVAADMVEEDEDATAGPSSTHGVASSVQTVPSVAELKTTIALMLRKLSFGSHVKLTQLVEQYNETARMPASEADIDQASDCTTTTAVTTTTVTQHLELFSELRCKQYQNTQRAWHMCRAATASRLACVHALPGCCLGAMLLLLMCQTRHARIPCGGDTDT